MTPAAATPVATPAAAMTPAGDAAPALVSVAMCTHDGAEFVERQLASILEQTRPPDEIVVCDDASEDETPDLVAAVAQRHPERIRLVRNERNLGYVANFAMAIGLCRGDVVFLSDQDDVWMPEKVEVMLGAFARDPAALLAYSDGTVVDRSLSPVGRTLFDAYRRVRLGRARAAVDLVRWVGVHGCTIAVRPALSALAMPVGRGWGHDHWLAFMAEALGAARPVDKELVAYRLRSGSAGRHPLVDPTAHHRRDLLRQRASEDYVHDRLRFESLSAGLDRLADRLEGRPRSDVSSSRASVVPSGSWSMDRLDGFREEVQRRTAFARMREELGSLPRARRLARVSRALASGEYDRYLHGAGTAVKDMLR